MREYGGPSVTSGKANSNTSCLGCGRISTSCQNRMCASPVLWTADVLASLRIPTSSALCSPASPMCNEPLIGYIWHQDTPFVSACKIPRPNCFELESPPSSPFAEIDDG